MEVVNDNCRLSESISREEKKIYYGFMSFKNDAEKHQLSNRKFVIVCHEKVVRIPLEGDEILRFHRERTLGAAKALMNAKVDEPRISDIPVAYDITDVFSEDLLGLPPQRQVEFYIDLVPGAMPVAKSPYPNVVGDALSRRERVKSRRVRGMILAAQSKAFKQENVLAERLHGLDPQMEEKEMRVCSLWIEFSIRYAPFEALYGKKCRLHVLWAEIRGSSLIGPERNPLEFEVGDRVLLRVTPWKGVVHFGKKSKLAPRYVGPFEILERIGLVAYRLRLPKELNNVHDTFHVSNLKKCLADANLHVPLDDIKVGKTLHFVKEPVEIMDREIRKLKRRKITLVKVMWNSKHGSEFTWEHEYQMRIKYPQLSVDRVVKLAS
ncbi:hypothetical protein Tco_0569373 [Tanacetum coccineum]